LSVIYYYIMSYNTYSSSVSVSATSNIKVNMTNITNLDEIEEHYSTIFYRVEMDPFVFVFDGEYFRKSDSCNLFLKFVMNVIEYYCKPNKQNCPEITVVLDLNNVNKKTLNIDFLMKFVKKFQKEYENKIILRKFFIINCPSVLKKVYLFVRPFLHPETQRKISVIKQEKSLSREHYYTLQTT
jgi:hypothetical protein